MRDNFNIEMNEFANIILFNKIKNILQLTQVNKFAKNIDIKIHK